MSQPIVHFEIAGRDGERLESFYFSLLGWKIERQNMGGYAYGKIAEGVAGPIGGGIRHEPQGVAEVVLYVEVEDIHAAQEKAEELGASVRIPVMETPEVTFCLVADPEGNPLGLVQKQ